MILLRDILISLIAWPVALLITAGCWAAALIARGCVFFGDRRRRTAHRVCTAWGWTLLAISPGIRPQWFGRENLPKDGPVIFMADHQSYTDIPILYGLGGEFKWMADQALFRIPFLGWSMGLAGYIPVDRGDARAAVRALQQARDWLEKEVSIFLFPEGTRSRSGAFARFQMGGFRLAARTQVMIVPIVVVGSRQFLPRGGNGILRFWRPIEVHILPAVRPSLEEDPKALRTLARKVRAEMVRLYRRRVRAIRSI
ncbi:MAG: hypothetical protein COV76_01160 [Candidatus Omnitrophica bacterium CG11_big_fil_rev_8_21_14_0_20_64_10]|nr:MAG: hypothetical protein COV76_01160 [Candidatus Omnitrophica bacterium CG11_big_fil_rev_8_21_14_0_20_64_10]